jgi:hypothetical protein
MQVPVQDPQTRIKPFAVGFGLWPAATAGAWPLHPNGYLYPLDNAVVYNHNKFVTVSLPKR